MNLRKGGKCYCNTSFEVRRPSFTALLPFQNDFQCQAKIPERGGDMEEGGMDLFAVIFIRENLLIFQEEISSQTFPSQKGRVVFLSTLRSE